MEFTIVGDKENQQIDTVEKWKQLIFRLFVQKKKKGNKIIFIFDKSA